MARNNLDGMSIEIDNAPFVYHGHAVGRIQLTNALTGMPFVVPQPDGTTQPPTDAQFDDLLAQDGRVVLRSKPSSDPTRRYADAVEWTTDQAERIDPTVRKKLAQVEMLDDAGVMNGSKAIARHLHENWGPEQIARFGPHDSPHTIRRWRAKRGRPGSRHARQMVRMTGRVPRGAYGAGVPNQVLAAHALRHWTTKGRVRDGHAGYVAEMTLVNAGRHPVHAKPATPYAIASEDTFRRRVNALESEQTTRAKKGDEAVEQDWRGGGRPLTADFAMQRVIIDHTRLDVHVLDDERGMVLGRPWLTLAIDVATRCIVAHLITFLPPSAWTVGEILRRIALPKRPPALDAERYPILRQIRGKPHEIIVDNAAEFRSHTMEAAIRAAGPTVRFAPLRKARYRAICEREIGTMTRLVCENMPGRVLPIAEARRLKHDAAAEAVAIMLELEAVANKCVAEINTSPHDGLGGRQPALMFEKDANARGIDNFADLDSFRRDTMAIVEGAQLSPSGIRAFDGLRYHDVRRVPELLSDLRPLEARRRRRDDATATVDFRYDPMDVSRIHVWNRRTRKYVELGCADAEYSAGMPLALHDQIRREARKEGAAFNTQEERLLARNRRIEAIRNLDPEGSAAARAAVAELYEIPRIRQITGNIVHLHHEPPEQVTVAEFISHDRAATTSLDDEILSPRAPIEGRRRKADGARDRRDAGGATAEAAHVRTAAPAGRRRGATLRGDVA